MSGLGHEVDNQALEAIDVIDPDLTPKPEGARPPSPDMRWCPFVGNWCKGHDCYCELTLFA